MNKSFDLFKCHIDFLTSNLFGIVGQFPNTHSLQPMAKLIMRRVSLAEGNHRGLAAKLPGPGQKKKKTDGGRKTNRGHWPRHNSINFSGYRWWTRSQIPDTTFPSAGHVTSRTLGKKQSNKRKRRQPEVAQSNWAQMDWYDDDEYDRGTVA